MGRVRAMGQWNSEELRKLLEVKGGGFWEFLVFGTEKGPGARESWRRVFWAEGSPEEESLSLVEVKRA